MDTKIFVVSRIEGEYAYIKECNSSEELFIALALFPNGVDVGSRLLHNGAELEIID